MSPSFHNNNSENRVRPQRSKFDKPKIGFSQQFSNGESRFRDIRKPFPRTENRSQISAFVKKIAELKTEKGRIKESQFLIEGFRCVVDVLKVSEGIIDQILITAEFKQNHTAELKDFKKGQASIKIISEEEMKYLSFLNTPPGILAVAFFSHLKPRWASCRKITLLDSVQDPSNVGAIFRNSLAMGFDAVILGKGTCDVYNPKVVRSSVGEFLKIPFEVEANLESKISFLRQSGFSIIATDSHSRVSIENLNLKKKKVAFILGNEGNGIDPKLKTLADDLVAIPLQNSVDSLNVAVAHGIMSYYINQII